MQRFLNRFLILALGLLALGGPALADVCESRARLAYEQELQACRNGGGGTQCRWNTDCAIGQVCNAGLCVNQPITCVRRCSARYANGNCYQWAQDFCGVTPSCTAYCTARYPNGNCYQWGPDKCANGGVQCVPNCTARYPNGNCYQWGADLCNG